MSNVTSDFDTAVLAYQAHCDLVGTPAQEAIEAHSNIVNGVVYLRANSTGYMARYSIKRGRLLS